MPGSTVTYYSIYPINGQFFTSKVGDRGTLRLSLNLLCGEGWLGVHAVGTGADGGSIDSPTVKSHCEQG